MRRAALVALVVVAGLWTSWSAVTSAQEIDANACEQSCRAQESICVSACGAHPDPVECEGRCRDQVEDCLRQCR